jgi:hypothetical protein
MAVNLIEFKLHAGKVPYFVKDYLGGLSSNGRHYGISHDDVNCYLPTEVVALAKNDFITAVVAIDMYTHNSPFTIPPEEPVAKTTEEKTTFVTNWLTARGF